MVTRHCKISTKMRLLVIQTDDDVCQLPMDDIGMLMIETTRAVITTCAIADLLKRDVKIVFCDDKHLPIGETSPYETESSRRAYIIQQIRWDEARKDLLWQHIICFKIRYEF